MKKIPKQEYTAEFRELAVKRMKAGQSIGAVAREPGLIEQALCNWVKAAAAGKLNSPGTKEVTAEQMELSRVRAESIRLKRQYEILKKSNGILCEGCAVKYAWIDKHRPTYGLAESCAVLGVSISGYQAWKRGGTPDRKRLTDAQMLALIQAIHAEPKGAYSSPRMVRELRARGFPASKERVERLMRENDNFGGIMPMGWKTKNRGKLNIGLASAAAYLGPGYSAAPRFLCSPQNSALPVNAYQIFVVPKLELEMALVSMSDRLANSTRQMGICCGDQHAAIFIDDIHDAL